MVKGLKASVQLRRQAGRRALPRRLVFEPTLTCNLTCAMCERYVRPCDSGDQELTLANIEKVIERLPRTVTHVYISGGEPCMRSDIVDICKKFLEKNIFVAIQTNGTFVERFRDIARLKDIELLFSLDGPPHIHNQIRGAEYAYDRTLCLLNTVHHDFKKKFSLTSVIANDNINVLPQLFRCLIEQKLKPAYIVIELARRYTQEDVDTSIRIMGLEPNDIRVRCTDTAVPSYSYGDLKNSLVDISNALRRYNIKYTFYPRNLSTKMKDFYYRMYRQHNSLYCTHLDDMRIDSQGNVIPCFCIRKKFGNVMTHSIEEIWNSREFRTFRINLVNNNLLPVCETCFRAVDRTYFQNMICRRSMNIIKEVMQKIT